MPARKMDAARISENEARRRKEVALAEIREMERDEKKGALVPADEVLSLWADKLSALRDRILMLPDRLAARLVGRTEIDTRHILRDELEDALRGVYGDAQ